MTASAASPVARATRASSGRAGRVPLPPLNGVLFGFPLQLELNGLYRRTQEGFRIIKRHSFERLSVDLDDPVSRLENVPCRGVGKNLLDGQGLNWSPYVHHPPFQQDTDAEPPVLPVLFQRHRFFVRQKHGVRIQERNERFHSR